ncbi:MAG: DUF2339 domain-containing protein [Sphingobium sp.]
MEALLFIAVVILGVLLFDTRGRLKRLESRIADRNPAPASAEVRRTATIVDRRAESIGVPADYNAGIEQADAASQEEHEPAPTPATAFVAPGTPAAPEPVTPIAPVSTVPADRIILPPIAATADSPAVRSRPAGQRFEDLFGRQLPIWAGGITLAVAGVLLVKYSIDAGLLSPLVRVIFGLLFGGGLIAGAEVALRQDSRVGDPRVRQALSGAGIATLYAAILAAANLYALVGPATAFIGLALVTALAMVLSIRFGAPSAILGLVGGLAAPALVSEGPPNIPLLAAYLALAIGGLTALSRRQKWMWLGTAALIGGAGWGGILILTGALDFASSLSLGLLLLLLGLALPWVVFSGARAVALRTGGAVVAAAQIALLVAKGGFEPLVWGLYLLLASALCWLAWREERFRLLPPVGLAIGLLLAALWPEPPLIRFVLVLLALVAIHLIPAAIRLWRAGGSMMEAGQIAGAALIGYGVTLLHYHAADGTRDVVLALVAVAAAAVPAVAALAGWRAESRGTDARFATLSIASALLLGAGACIGLPDWLLPMALAALAAALVLLHHAAMDRRIGHGATAFLAAMLAALLLTGLDYKELDRLAGEESPSLLSLLRWTVAASAAMLGGWRLGVRGRAAVAMVAAWLAYGALAQIAPLWSLPLIAGIGMLAAGEARRRGADYPVRSALGGFAFVALLWAMEPLARWLDPALVSLVGEPMLVIGLPSVGDALLQLALPTLLALAALWRGQLPVGRRARIVAGVALTIIGTAALHSLYKHLFQLEAMADLTRAGLAERTLWEALMLAAGYALWRWRAMPMAALAGGGAAVAHGLWYSQILFSPLLTQTAVGPWPIANLLLPAFAVLFASLSMIERTATEGRNLVARIVSVTRMILIVLFAYAGLRQLFCGSILWGTPVSATESIAVSVLAIALGVGFLLWGIKSGRHDWRIGSLLLMLSAAGKVFLVDAAGLEGLLRILSFLALGFSLIGIGWLYSRFLRTDGGSGQA